MDNIILGLLVLSNRTIYQLRDRINKGLNLMYSSSLGSMQAALKKLLVSEYVTFTEDVENGKYKKTYSITEKGKQYFFRWVNAPLEQPNIKSPELAKLYFMGFADKKVRAESVKQYLESLYIQQEALAAICTEGENTKVPEEAQDILQFELSTAYYGRDLLQFNIDWFEKLLSQIQEG
ncbi:MAG: PadR family transcriptional regulator [Lachnospiraceae bacterium]